MNNKKLYQDTFSQVHFQGSIDPEKLKKHGAKHRPIGRMVLLAAAVCLLAGTVAAATRWMNLRDLEIRAPQPPVSSGVESSSSADASQSTGTSTGTGLISLSGYMDTPESRALAEWKNFLAVYDDGGALDRIGNNPTGFEEKYGQYLVYTQEMADKLDEIIAKYGLSLHTESFTVPAYGWNEALNGQLLSEEISGFTGYMYEDGTFHFDADIDIPEYGLLDFQFDRCVRGSFADLVLNVENVDAYTQWVYTTACGLEVTLALSDFKGLILLELPDSFVTVNVLAGTATPEDHVFSSGPITAAELEYLADSMDFTVLTPVVRGDALDMEALWPENEPAEDEFLTALGMGEAAVQRFFAEFLRLAESGDRLAAAESLAYPVVLEANGEAVWAETPEDLLPFWDSIFTDVLWERIQIHRYDKERSDIWVDGTCVRAAGGAIRMEMVDGDLAITAVSVENGCGVWRAEQSFSGTDWYQLRQSTGVSQEEAEPFLYRLMEDIRDGNWLPIAERLVYPCVVTTPAETVTLNTPEDLLPYYDFIIGADAKTLVGNIGSQPLFGHDGLAAAGGGMVWFGSVPGEGLRIFTIQVPDGWSIRPLSMAITAD